jgi:glycosyltransferase involved in cell wall biosynthesis
MVKVVAVHYSHYPRDVRPQRAAEALAEAGMAVDVVCLRGEGEAARETVNGVRVHRLSLPKHRGGKAGYLLNYAVFVLAAFVKVSLLHLRNRYCVAHIHNMPDVLVLAALTPRLGGCRILLDLHDPMPELFMAKYAMAEDHLFVRLLKLQERWCIRFADRVITPNTAFRNLFISRGCPEEKISIVMNAPLEKIFHMEGEDVRRPPAADPSRFVLLYHGGIFERHGLDTGLEALDSLRGKIPNLELRVFGLGDFTERFLELVDRRGMRDMVTYHGYATPMEIAREIRSIDAGIIPNKKSKFIDLNMPVRIFEYLSLGKPVIVPRTRGIMDYFDDDSIFFFEAGDAASLAKAVLELYTDAEKRRQVTERGVRIYTGHRWELQRKHLVGLVEGLAAGNGRLTVAEAGKRRPDE